MRGSVARLAASILLGLGLAGCDDWPGRPDEVDRYRRPSEVMDFATLYATHCSGCHGADGQRGPARPLADPLYLALVAPERFASIVAAGVPGTSMPAFGADQGGPLDLAQIRVLVEEIFSKWSDPISVGSGPLPPYTAADARAAGHAPGDRVRGAGSFAQFCARCHGIDGRGGSAGSVVDPSLLALVSEQMLRTSIIAGRPDLGMPDWRTVSRDRAMTPQEISDVVAWLAAQGGTDGARP